LAKEETVLQGMIHVLIEMEMSVDKTKVMRTSRESFQEHTAIDLKQMDNNYGIFQLYG
jgi:hypothetical protein